MFLVQGYKAEILNIAEVDVDAAEKQLRVLEKTVPEDFEPNEWERVID